MCLEPIDLEAILVVEGGGVLEQLGRSQRVRCHERTDVDDETVSRKHETSWRAERELCRIRVSTDENLCTILEHNRDIRVQHGAARETAPNRPT